MSESSLAVVETPDSPGNLPPDAPAEQQDDGQRELAIQRGWVDKDAWKGSPERWSSAEEWNKRHDSVMPFVQRENHRLEQKLKQQAEEIRKRDERLAALEKREAERDQARGEIAESSLLSELATANAEGDHRRVAQVQAELSKHYAKQNVPRETPKPVADEQQQAFEREVKETFQDFMQNNPAFNDMDMRKKLMREVKVVSAGEPDIGVGEALNEARDRVRRLYPDLFQTKRAPPMAETGGTPPPTRSNGAKTWNDLKPEVKESLDAFIKGSEHHSKLPLDKARASILKQADDSYFRSR